jgi:hypothetical protein
MTSLRRLTASSALAWGAIGWFAALGASCGPASRRDLSTVFPQRRITFEDMCRLQDYFDQRRAAGAAPFRATDEQSAETQETEADENGRRRRRTVGEGTYLVSDPAARRQLQRLLADEYDRLPALRLTGQDTVVRVHVEWWASGRVRRLRPDRPIELTVGDETVSLPFSACVGEFLFGHEVYAMRRRVLDDDAVRARGEIPAERAPVTTEADAGTREPESLGTPPPDAAGDAGPGG